MRGSSYLPRHPDSIPVSPRPTAAGDETLISWRTSTTDEDAVAAIRNLQARLEAPSPTGTSWAEATRKLPPEKRLETAIGYLPLPAAFNEAAIALRALVSRHMEEQRDPTASLKLLYWFSAVASFMPARAEKAQAPGFSVVAIIPGARLFGLKFDWNTLGYEKLPLLTARDIRMLIALWGEPQTHRTLLELHPELWSEYEEKLIERVRKNDAALAERLAASLEASGAPLPIRVPDLGAK
jgi:hypothetical protein